MVVNQQTNKGTRPMQDLTDYQKLDWISFAIQEAMNGNLFELDTALLLVEDLRDNQTKKETNL
jgi:hypothetical protein